MKQHSNKVSLRRLLSVVIYSYVFSLLISTADAAPKVRRHPFNVYNLNFNPNENSNSNANGNVNTNANANQPTADVSGSGSGRNLSNRLMLLRAQCKATCMRKMVDNDQSLSDVQKAALLTSEKLMETCLAKHTCAACERGCNVQLLRDHTEPTAPIVCPQQCRTLPETLVRPCLDSCRLMHELSDDRKRVDFTSQSGSQNQTARKCTVNFDCPASQKCCRRQCGACDQTVPFPTILDVNERDDVDAAAASSTGTRQIGFEIEWTVPDNVPVEGPIVYVIDVRSFFGRTFDEDRASAWSTILMTTNKGAFLHGIRIGELYRFRLAAVSPDGTQGYSAPTQPKRSSVEPQAPSAPDNLREENRVVKSNGLVDIQFGWEAPVHADLEVTKYKLFWFQKSDMSNGKFRASREIKKTISASQMSFVLEDLNADTVYCFAVQAICDYNDRKLRSQRAVVCANTSAVASQSDSEEDATTPPFALTTPENDEDSEEFDVTQDYSDWDADTDADADADADADNEIPTAASVSAYDTNQVTNSQGKVQVVNAAEKRIFSVLQASLIETYYEGGELQAAISWTHATNANSKQTQRASLKYSVIWRPIVCADLAGSAMNFRPQTTVSIVTEAQQATLGGLRFGCQYQVVVRLLATNGIAGNETLLTFNAPRCSEVVAKDGRSPLCPTTAAPRAQLNINAPKNVQVRLIESWTRQSWTKYYHAFVNWTANPMAHSYKIIYGRKAAQSSANAPRMEKGGAITKVVTHSYTSLLDLEADTTYVLQLQALTEAGESRVVQVHFVTSDNTLDQLQAAMSDGRKPARRKAASTNGVGRLHLQSLTMWCVLVVNIVWFNLRVRTI